MRNKSATRESNLELLRIFCIIFIIGDHFVGQSGMAQFGSWASGAFYVFLTSLSRVACSIFIIISAWFLVDCSFKVQRIFHVWLTVIMYTVPITLLCKFVWNVEVSRDMLVAAFHPIGDCPLWFAGYYIVLIILSPVLNMILHDCSKKAIEIILFPFGVLMVGFSTLSMRLGFFSHDIWVLIFLYLFTGYIKQYPIVFFQKKKNCFFLFFLVEFLICFFRTMSTLKADQAFIWQVVATYMELYRARMQTLPNLLMAYSLFFGFKNIKIKKSVVINKMAGVTLGVYCFHQVPCFYTFLWKNILRADSFIGTSYQYIYTIGVIIGVWIVGSLVELLRGSVSACLIENRKWYREFCQYIDDIVENVRIVEK